MEDFYKIKEALKIMPITQIPLRVVIYSRVSTDSEEQLTSITNQKTYYKKLIENTPKWTLIEEYVDEGITGTSTKKREAFQRMISDGIEGKFDMIITKSVSRFARNTLDSLQNVRILTAHGVGVWFHSDGILTFEADGELRLSIMSAFAQGESEKKSEAVRFGLQESIKRGTVFGFDNMFGYRLHGGKLEIDEAEVPMIQKIFELYATDRYSMNQIEKILYDDGYRNHNGNRISHATLSHIIRNPKYKGVFAGRKVRKKDLFDDRVEMLPQNEWVIIDGEKGRSIVPPIVSEELWAKANRVLEARSIDVKTRQNKCNHPNLLTGKLWCVHCNLPYHRKASKTSNAVLNSAWVCAGKIRNGTASCPSIYLYENEVKQCLYELFIEDDFDIDDYIDQYIKLVSEASSSEKNTNRQNELEKELALIEKKKTKILEFNVLGQVSDQDYIAQNNALNEEYQRKSEELANVRSALDTKKRTEEDFEKMRGALQQLKGRKNIDFIDPTFVRTYIERIDVSMIDGRTMNMDVILKTGDKISRILKKNLSSVNRRKHIYTGRRLTFRRKTPYGRGSHEIPIQINICFFSLN